MKKKRKSYNSSEEQVVSKKKRKIVIIRSILLLGILLSINTFAWFVYITKADVSLKGSVVSWEVKFLDQNSIVKDINVDINDMRPGMLPFNKNLKIMNSSDVDAEFNYEINQVEVLGQPIYTELSTEEIEEKLKNDFPFQITITTDKKDIDIDQSANFDIDANWEYEAQNKYYQVNSLYRYDPSIYYYTYNGTSYQVDNTVTEDNFNDKINTGIYVEKDDADSFFGQACGEYTSINKKSCVSMKMKLEVSQKK